MALRTAARLALPALVMLGGGLLPAVAAQAAGGRTLHVRPDGGTAAQCTGRADARYPGSGRNRACAVCRDPRLRDDSFASFDPRLRRSSPAVDSARRDRLTPATDFFGYRRPDRRVDRGAVER